MNKLEKKMLDLEAEIARRKQTEGKLKETEEGYRKLIETSPYAIFVHIDQKIIFMNPTGLELLGAHNSSEIIGKSILDLTHPDYLEVIKRRQELLKKGEAPRNEYFKALRLDGSVIDVETTAARVTYQGKSAIMAIIRDITERKKGEEALRTSRDYLRRLTDSMWDAVFSVKMPDRVIEWVNDSFRLTGYEPQDCIGRTTEFVYPDESEFLDFGNKLKTAIEAGEDVLHAQQLLKRKNGEILPAEITTTIFREKGQVARVTSIVADITERKKAERERLEYQERLKAMASQLSRVQEVERRKLSKRLHDSISQGLAVAKLNLQQSAESITDVALAEKLNDVSTELRRIMEESYSLMLELSNPILYELGLVSALKALLESRFLEDQGIQCKLRACEDHLGLDQDTKVTLYQAIRELLVNIAKHAKAKNVEVLIEKEGKCLRISVKDDGVGFEASQVQLPSEAGGFGLFNVRESLGGIGGELKIESKPGGGTVATITVPLQCESKA